MKATAAMKAAAALWLVALLAFGSDTAFARSSLSDAEIRDRIIQESVRSYPGNCPCPYNLARNGRRCGGRSAYSKPGGASPICYPENVSDDQVRQYRKRNGL